MIKRYSRDKMSFIWSDENKFKKFLQVELAVLYAYMKKGKITKAVYDEIAAKADFDMERVEEIELKVKHDVIAFLTAVGEKVGRYSKYIHMGMTSSDMLDTANALILKESSDHLIRGLKDFRKIVLKKAHSYKLTPIVGRTHGVHAEPTSVGMKMLVWVDDIDRSIKMFENILPSIKRGKISGAVGNYANISPEIEKIAMDFMNLDRADISSQIVSRDVYSDYMYAVARAGAVIEKIALQIRLLQRTETREFEEPFSKGQKGSSAMPHKRNPVICEQMCGLSRVLRGNLASSLENIALWDERDISHSSVERIILPDSSVLLDYMTDKISFVISDMAVYEKNLKANFDKSFNLLFSQRVLLKLIDEGMNREDAYAVVQECAMKSWEKEIDFKRIISKDTRIKNMLSQKKIDELFNLKYYLAEIETVFKRFK